MRILGVVITTFLIAVIYGLFLTTMDFMGPNYSPANSGHKAANNIYGLFGSVNTEIKRTDGNPNPSDTTVAHKIAMPYAVTADLSALLGGKLEVSLFSLIHSSGNHAPTTSS